MQGLATTSMDLTGIPPYLSGLNDAQRKAVETVQGPVLILAGAGTGKTRALTTRLAHLLFSDAATPGQILAVTFTNKAAAEMRHRVSQILGGVDVAGWWIGTFHSLAAKMLRRHAELVGLRSNFTIIDEDDQLRLMKQVFELQQIDAKAINPRMVLALIDRWKNIGLLPQHLSVADISDKNNPLSGKQLVGLYQAYQDRLQMLNACDFGDLLLHLVTIFKDPANGVLQQYHARFKFLLVDEYQDTNTVQYQWLRLLAQAHHNICCVGDDDQSIYSWRGANVQNILNFERDFPEATVIRLEQNYRSTQPILDAANALISNNRSRLGKNLWTQSTGTDPVRITVMTDQTDEARQICDQIESDQRRGTSLDEIAVLVRTTSQMRAFEDRFIDINIPYRIIGGPRFYERQEIRDAIAYLRLVQTLDDDLAFERIVNLPKRGIGAKTIQDLQVSARAMRRSLFLTVEDLVNTDELKPGVRTTLRQFSLDVLRWKGLSEAASPSDLAKMILEESGYVAMWRDDKSIEAAGRLENLQELTNAMKPYETLTAFLEHVALVTENQQNSDRPRVTLMTLHQAKGLEYEHVFLPGWEEGLFPSQRSMDEVGLAGLEEERRLAYVGITRARRKAVISYALRRMLYGQYNDTVPSRFIEELPPHAVADERKVLQQRWASQQQIQPKWSSGGWNNNQRGQKKAPAKKGPLIIDSYATEIRSTSDFRIGQRIFHEKFGYGRVTAIDGEKLDVSFEKAGAKKVIDRFVTSAEK